MEEIKVGEYIRTKDGQIGIFQNIDEHCRHYGERLEDTIYIINTEKNEYLRLIDNDIVKHSKNIIDLIEVGDIVEVQNKLDGSKTIFNLNKYIIGIYKEQIENGSIKLTSILTHEMYEQNCYKVGED